MSSNLPKRWPVPRGVEKINERLGKIQLDAITKETDKLGGVGDRLDARLQRDAAERAEQMRKSSEEFARSLEEKRDAEQRRHKWNLIRWWVGTVIGLASLVVMVVTLVVVMNTSG